MVRNSDRQVFQLAYVVLPPHKCWVRVIQVAALPFPGAVMFSRGVTYTIGDGSQARAKK
jgi:hypothetical protein